MGFFDGLQRWQKRRRAMGLLEAGEIEAATKVIGADATLRHELAEMLLEAGKLELSQALLGHEGRSTFSTLLTATPADVELERWKKEAVARELPPEPRALELAAHLRERGAHREARALLDRAAHAHKSWPLLRAAAEAWLDADEADHAWPHVEAAFALRRELVGTKEHDALLELHRRVVARRDGPEAVRVDLMMRGEVDPFVDDSYVELAQALMREGPPLTTRLELVSAPQELREGEARLEGDRKSATGLLRVGSAKLRMGELNDARVAFEQARAVAPRHFGVVLGLGATVRSQRTDAVLQVRTLPDLAPLPGLETVVPATPQLTNLELRVVQACARPLARWLPTLADSGRTVTLLPLDARELDLPQGLTAVRVESLFDLRPRGWAFAKAFARLVHASSRDPRGEGAAVADAYAQWLARKYGMEHLEVDAALVETLAPAP